MNTFFYGWILLIIAATAWDMGMRALPLVAALMGVLNIVAAISTKP